MATTEQTGIIEKILRAETPEEVERLVALALTTEKRADGVLRRINRAGVKRRKELSRP